MNNWEKINSIQQAYIIFLITSIKNMRYDYLQETDFSDNKNIDQAIKNMIIKWQSDIIKLEEYLMKKEISDNIPYTDILSQNVNSKSP